ncbi:ATP-binding cassette sub-family C member 4-like isoform X1 [Acropora millepora]|uniref:ATP-binding cassette sub-family C member 4-like isoform X1 n=2 Tax=Acropora millepora TaxID=45264 RepID=UPI001CF2CDB8|nr:ATP-binding cassette sub-family C member 4-like isoform X1 [Acropora millepora]
MAVERIHTLANPRTTAYFISKYFTFWWMNDIFKKGYKQPLQNADVYAILPDDESKQLTDRLERLWNEEVQDAKKKNRRPRLRNAFIKFLGFPFLFLSSLALLEEAMKILAPLLISRLISFFSPTSGLSKTDAYITALGLCLVVVTEATIHAPNFFALVRFGLALRISAGSLVYRKALRLSHSSLSQTTTGQIVNLMTSDIQPLEMVLFLHHLWIGPLVVVVVAILCWNEIGLAALPGVFLFVLLVPLQGYIGRHFARLRTKTAALSDQRIKFMNEIISGMRVIKMYTWEKPFAQLVAEIRRRETKTLKFASFFRAINGALYLCATALINLLVFSTYVASGRTLNAELLFFVVGLFMAIRASFIIFFGNGVMYLKQASVSEKRLQKFFELEERDFNISPELNSFNSRTDTPSLQLTNITAYWDQTLSPTLKDVSFEAKPGDLNIVVGPVGAGKSSLLMVLLGELPVISGERKVLGKIGYASQQAWIFSGTVKENIVFGQEFVQDRYLRVIEACALKKDLEVFHSGDSTLVGERGVVLSGGQKARISLARAVYHNADIYLLDDPLSAVDTQVGCELFDKCILGLLKPKICVLVTHQLQFLKEATSILCLKEGSCVGQGSFSDLSNIDVQSLVGIPESVDDSASETDDLEKEEKNKDATRSIETTTTVQPVDKTNKPATEKEDRFTGTVTWRVYFDYWKAGGGFLKISLLIILFLGAQASAMASDWWLARWADIEDENALLSKNSTTATQDISQTRTKYLAIYGALVANTLLLAFSGAGFFLYIAICASQNLHDLMFERLLGATIYFFDHNPVGRVLNRFSKDIGQMDDLLPYTYYDYCRLMVLSYAILLLNVVAMPYLLAAAIPIIALFLFIRHYYLKTSREIKRLEAMNRNPLYSHISATIQGLTTIRAYSAEDRFRHMYHVYQDDHTATWFLFQAGSRWLGSRLDFMCAMFIVVVTITPLLMAEGGISVSAGVVGLALTYAKVLTGGFQWCVRQSAEVESLMTSVERVQEYTRLDQETQPNDQTVDVPKDWPKYGIITAEGLYYAHHNTLPYVLRKMNFCIRAQEKVGVVGRTGAGKSSMIAALFRLAEPEGNVRIDAIPITAISLNDLRSNMSIIPQDPVLFSGSIRRNLDPFNQYDDSGLWNALQEVQLKETVSELPDGLDTKLTEGGSNFSVGQRQLVCLARAILKHDKILIIDEATANVDHSTDALIQETIRTKFKCCTVLTIAHRLNTIMDSDRVMVLDEGKLVEFEEPYLLLQNKDSLFSNMVEHTSQHLRTNLYETARQAYNSRHERNGDGELDACRKWSNAEATTVEQERELEPQQQEADNEDGFDDVLAMVRGSSSLEKEKLLLESTA